MEKTYPKTNAEKMMINEIGDSKYSLTLQYFSINKFINKNNSSVRLHKIICILILQFFILKNFFI